MPPGVLNMIAASRAQGVSAVAQWLADPRVRKVTFAGSTPVGKHLARESVASLRVAPATDALAQIGPMINTRAVEKIARHVDDAVALGARVLTGGCRLNAPGPNYYAPTVLSEAHEGMALSCEETFGPVQGNLG